MGRRWRNHLPFSSSETIADESEIKSQKDLNSGELRSERAERSQDQAWTFKLWAVSSDRKTGTENVPDFQRHPSDRDAASRIVGGKPDREGTALPVKSWERPERRRKTGRSQTEGWGKLKLPSAAFIFDGC